MAERNDSERLSQALQSMREARAEISSEARWLRHELDPRTVAHRAVDRHTTGILLTAFGVGLATAWLAFHKRGRRPVIVPQPAVTTGAKPSRSFISGMLSAAIPLALKFATSRPVIDRIISQIQPPRAPRATVPA